MNPALDRNSVQFGKYMLVERLGRGGMAEVWKARISGPAGRERYPAAAAGCAADHEWCAPARQPEKEDR